MFEVRPSILVCVLTWSVVLSRSVTAKKKRRKLDACVSASYPFDSFDSAGPRRTSNKVIDGLVRRAPAHVRGIRATKTLQRYAPAFRRHVGFLTEAKEFGSQSRRRGGDTELFHKGFHDAPCRDPGHWRRVYRVGDDTTA